MNSLCTSPLRRFDGTVIIGVNAGALAVTIDQLKKNTLGWAIIHARIILGYLYTHPGTLAGVHAIIPNPGRPVPYGQGMRPHHPALVIQQALEQDERSLPFVLDPPLIEKTAATGKMRETRSIGERTALGQTVYEVLRVPDPGRVVSRTIMLYDDVFTSGTTLNAVARRLKEAGAARVIGLALARQPRW
ncbi:hypothetical protein [Nonomuraea sp. NPDC049625]|uniref:ComF family protein n=1 Tax=Nonomuraea sp. NPDC049625 TaxID=3155775 RepID=UPI0034391D25